MQSDKSSDGYAAVVADPCPAEARIYPAFANSVDPHQLASDLNLHYLPFSI